MFSTRKITIVRSTWTVFGISLLAKLSWADESNVDESKIRDELERCLGGEKDEDVFSPYRIDLRYTDFGDFLRANAIYADKSLLIVELLEKPGRIHLISRPPGWGKSVNLDMLNKFFEIETNGAGERKPKEECRNRKLFLGGEDEWEYGSFKTPLLPLKISKREDVVSRYLGEYPTIFLDFEKRLETPNYRLHVLNRIERSFARHGYLLHSYGGEKTRQQNVAQREKFRRYLLKNVTADEANRAVLFLSELLYKHFKRKVFIFVDDYHYFFHSHFMFTKSDELYYQVDLKLYVTELFERTFMGNAYIEKAVLTGFLPIAKEELFGPTDHVREHTVLGDDFSRFYGITRPELNQLISKVPGIKHAEKISNWYDGYVCGNETIFCTKSIMACLQRRGAIDNSFLKDYNTTVLRTVFNTRDVVSNLYSFLAKRRINATLHSNFKLNQLNYVHPFSYLVFYGTLTAYPIKPQQNLYEVTMPNKQLRILFNYYEKQTWW